ncbi:MAG TPA: polysaccharide deacetylase family protein [Chryseolinea sp.]|nr:polysaccharide deacetylase family protein [Chryseolinea sp.]
MKLLVPVFFLALISCASRTDRSPGICLSFDDRTINEWYAMIPLLDKYQAHVTFFVTQLDSLRPDEIRKLKALAERGHEIASHGARHVNAETYIKEHGYRAWLDNEVDHSINVMKLAGFDPVTFAYPYGAKYWFTDFLLLQRFNCVRSVAVLGADADIASLDDVFYNFDNDDKLLALGIDVNSGLTRQMVRKAIERSVAKREVMMLYGHTPATAGDSVYRFDPGLLEFILEEGAQNGLRFYTFNGLRGE